MIDHEELRIANKDPIAKVFIMDHDFVCLSKQRDEQYDSEFSRGIEHYIQGDWHPAKMCFDLCEKKILEGEVNFKDGPLKRVMSILENSKCILPEDWVLGSPNAFDWDKKPVPPEVPEFENYAHD